MSENSFLVISPCYLPNRWLLSVILLTLCLTHGGCAYIERHYAEPCNNRAYVDGNVSDYIQKRFPQGAPVRLAIIPYAAPANISAHGSERPGMGNDLAWKVHSDLVASGEVPLAEVFNRQDWPGKKEEFFTGNFGALAVAREAGYDLVVVGLIEQLRSLDALTSYTKVIEVDSGITVYYAKTDVSTNRPMADSALDSVWLGTREPNKLYTPEITSQMSRCIVRGMKNAGY